MKTHLAARNTRLVVLPLLIGISIVLLSCNITSVFQPSTPTPTNSPTFTASPTITPSPTHTSIPTQTPTPTSTPEPTLAIPSGTPVSLFHHIPIRADATSAEGKPEDRWYIYVTDADQDLVLDYYLQKLPSSRWEIDWVSENDKGGYIIYRKNVLDFIYVFEDKERGVTIVEIFLSTSSPSLNP